MRDLSGCPRQRVLVGAGMAVRGADDIGGSSGAEHRNAVASPGALLAVVDRFGGGCQPALRRADELLLQRGQARAGGEDG